MSIKALFVFFCIISIGFVNGSVTYSKGSVDYVSLFYSVVDNVTQQVCQKYDLTISGGGGGMMDSIYEMDITFNANYPLAEDRAREILVFATESYLEKINTHGGVRRYLRNFPFTEKNLSISITNCSAELGGCLPPEVKWADLWFGKILFRTGAFERGCFEYEIEESYQEAKEKVAASKGAM